MLIFKIKIVYLLLTFIRWVSACVRVYVSVEHMQYTCISPHLSFKQQNMKICLKFCSPTRGFSFLLSLSYLKQINRIQS